MACSCYLSLMHIVPICVAGFYALVIIRTLVTVNPHYNAPMMEVPVLVQLEGRIPPSVLCSFHIWLFLSLITAFLTFSLPLKSSCTRIHRRLSVLSILGISVVIIYEVSMFGFIYQVYSLQLVSGMKFLSFFPFVSSLTHSVCQLYTLSLNLWHGQFTKFNIIVSLIFNYVMITHIVSMIITGVHLTPTFTSYLMSLFAVVGMYYRLWAATKYTDLLLRKEDDKEALSAKMGPCRPKSQDKGTLVAASNKLSSGFRQDSDHKSYLTKGVEEKSHDRLRSEACVYRNIFTCKNFNWYILKLIIAIFGTTIYLMTCYVIVYYVSMVINYFLDHQLQQL